jgi:hypothetical protein
MGQLELEVSKDVTDAQVASKKSDPYDFNEKTISVGKADGCIGLSLTPGKEEQGLKPPQGIATRKSSVTKKKDTI